MQAPILYHAEGLAPVVAIRDDGRLLAMLDKVMLGWNMAPLPAMGQGPEPAIRIHQTAAGWTCTGETYDQPVTFADPVATACSLIAALYKAHTLQDRHGLVLHAAGVRVGGGLVLLTGHYRAGKSVVTTACAAAGLQVFSDDIIPLDDNGSTALAPGLAIRLRLPVPENLTAETLGFIDSHRIASSKRYTYLRPPPDLLARRGETARIRAVVSLRRAEGAVAQLSHLAAGDALSETIRRNFAREVPAGRILDAFDGLIGRVPCLSLAYGRAEDAAALLHDAFAGDLPETVIAAAKGPAPRKSKRRARRLAASAVIHRQPGARTRERDGQAFLTDVDEQVIFNLNPTATAVWRVLEHPAPFGEITAIFAAGFPDRDPEDICADLSRLIRDLAEAGLARIETA